jgi:hypothetical protein
MSDGTRTAAPSPEHALRSARCLSVPRRPSWRSSPRGPTNWAGRYGQAERHLESRDAVLRRGLSTLQSAVTAAIPAGLAVAKGAVGTLLGRTGTASWLPARTDPESTSTTN